MEQIRDIKGTKYGLEGKVEFSLMQQTFLVMVEEGGTIAYAQKCADYLNALPEKVIDDLCAASIRYCNKFLDYIGEPLRVFGSPRDVLRCIQPGTLIVPCLPNDAPPVLHLELNCDWEPEHGMEWVIRDGRVVCVSPFDGQNPLGDFSKRDAWNFV
jgi:hypothetical protein